MSLMSIRFEGVVPNMAIRTSTETATALGRHRTPPGMRKRTWERATDEFSRIGRCPSQLQPVMATASKPAAMLPNVPRISRSAARSNEIHRVFRARLDCAACAAERESHGG